MGGKQSINKIKIQDLPKGNTSSKIRVGVEQSQHQEIYNRNAVDNNLFQQQHTLAKRVQTEKIRFK